MALSEETQKEIESAVTDFVSETDNVSDDTDTSEKESDQESEAKEAVESKSEVEHEEAAGEADDTSSDNENDSLGEGVYYEEDIPESLVERALNLGFSPEDVAAFPTQKSLITACVLAERTGNSQRKENREDNDDGKSGKTIDKLNLDEFEPEVANVLKTMRSELQAYKKELDGLKDSYKSVTEASQAANNAEITNWFDERVAKLGPDYESILGKGQYGGLDKKSSQFQNREKIAETIVVLLAGYQASGKEAPPRDEVFNHAVKMVLSDDVKKIADKKLQSSLTRRSKQHINRPGDRNAKKSNDENVEDGIAKMLDERYFQK